MSGIVRLFLVFAFLSFGSVSESTSQVLPPVDNTDQLVAEAVQAARTNQLSAERVLYAADQAIDAAAVIVSSVQNGRLIHSELKRLASGVPGARAIIVIGPDGKLIHDSYKYPALAVDLSDRAYFKEALTRSGLVIGQKAIGRTSGAAFVPLAKRLGTLTYVMVTTPYALVDVQSECGDCWSLAVQQGGKIVTMFPPEAEVSPNLLDVALKSNSQTGVRVARYLNSVVAIAWRKSADFHLTSVSVRGLPDTAAVDIDIH